MKGINFFCKNYTDIDLKNLKGYVIYCDPPYEDTHKYKVEKFDHDRFWDWVRVISKDNFVFISEYNAPDDFKCIWSKSLSTHMRMGARGNEIQKLFIHESMMNKILGRE